MNSRFKTKISSFLSAVGILSLVRSVKYKINNTNIDKRRFWKGSPLPAPKGNIPLFKGLGREAVTLTYGNESRDCILLDHNEEISLSLPINGKTRIKLGLACKGKLTIDGFVEVFLSKNKEAELKYLTPNRWHNVSIKAGSNAGPLVIKNKCTEAVAIAHPILENPYLGTEKRPKNIIVLLLDSLNRDSIGSFNNELTRYTPNISRFFKNALKYTNSFSQSEWTYPSIYSLLSSSYSLDHGMHDLKLFSPGFTPDENTLPMQLRGLGYSTLGYSTVKVFHPAFNGHVGFDRFFYDPFPQSYQTHRNICFQAIAQLEGNRDGKNFMFLHFLDTHAPWANTDELDENLLSNFRITDPTKEYDFYKRGHGDTKAEPIYDDEGIKALNIRRNARLKNIDSSLQILFDYLERTDQIKNSVVILISDHGFAYLGSGQPLLCNTNVNVPLLVLHPNYSAQTYDDLIPMNLDVAPTILKIAQGKFKGGRGKSFFPFGDKKDSHVISESIFGDLYKVAIRDKTFVYHFSCKFDKDSRTVDLIKKRYEFLYQREKESECLDVSNEYQEDLNLMRGILKKHLDKFKD